MNLAQQPAAAPSAPPTPPQEAAALDERAAFKAHFMAVGFSDRRFERYDIHDQDDEAFYMDPQIELLWQGWKARAALAAPAAQVAMPEGMLQRTEEMRLEFSNHRMLSRKRLVWMIECLFAHIALATPSPALPAAGGDALSQQAAMLCQVNEFSSRICERGTKGCHISHSNTTFMSEFQQGRAAGLEEAANFVNPHGKYGCSVADGIRALNKQEPTA